MKISKDMLRISLKIAKMAIVLMLLMNCGTVQIKQKRPDIDWHFDDGNACMSIEHYSDLLFWVRRVSR